MEFNLEEVVKEIEAIWLKNPKWGQDQIAEDMGLATYTLRRIMKKKVGELKITTKMKLLAWIRDNK